MAMTGFDRDAILSAIANAVSTVLPAGTTRATRPYVNASAAESRSPVNTISIALDLPTARISRCVPPHPGMVPMVTSGCPNWAVSPATMISHIIASSHPPPNANPFTAAIVCNVSGGSGGGGGGGEREGGGIRTPYPPTCRPATHRLADLGQVCPLREHVAAVRLCEGASGHLLDVRARSERAVTARQHDSSHGIIVIERLGRCGRMDRRAAL